MRDISAKMNALYQRMQELHSGALARDAYVDSELDAQHQRSDRHRGKLNFLACDRVELVDLELLRLRGENEELKAKVVSMAEHLCRCSQSSPALSGDIDADWSQEEAHNNSRGSSTSQLVWLSGGDQGLESGVGDGAVGQADSIRRGVLLELDLARFGRGPIGRAE